MKFFGRVFSAAFLSASLFVSGSMAAVLADIDAVVQGCAQGQCAEAVQGAIRSAAAAGAGANDMDETIAAIAGELVALVQANPELAPTVAEALRIAADAASSGSDVGDALEEAAAMVAEGNAAEIDLGAIASAGGGSSDRPANPSGGTNASRS
ncbi:MAG: hypothetical protein R3E44_14520 [Paracoccaceae bacterium]